MVSKDCDCKIYFNMKIFLIYLLTTICSTNAIIIDCEFVTGGVNSGNVSLFEDYTCWVTGMNLSDNATHVTGYTGTHWTGYTNALVKGLFLIENCPSINLAVFPKKISSIFSNLQAFFIDDCGIENVDGNELDDFTNLRLFILQKSLINRIPGNFFSANPYVRYIEFSDNPIERVGRGLLDNLTRLEKVWFIRNTCINKSATNSSLIPALIETLNDNCEDFEETTSLASTTVSMSTTPLSCEVGDIIDLVCGQEESLAELQVKNGALEIEINSLKAENAEINALIALLKQRIEVLES